MKSYFIGVLVLAITGMALIKGQAYQSDKAMVEEYWLNLPSSPVKIIRASKGQLLTLDNYSPARIIQYRLGWIIGDQGRIKIICRLLPQKTDLAPANLGNNEVHVVGLAFYDEVKECSRKIKAKLAVVEVNFEDGSVWKASNDIAASDCISARTILH